MDKRTRKNIALLVNPAAVPSGKKLDDEVRTDFITYTYRDRINDAIKTMIDGILKAGSGKISKDRISIKIRENDASSNLITKPKIIKNK